MSEVNIGRTVDLGAVSAYAIAVEHGYRGTEAEWIAEWDIVRQEAQAAEEALGAGIYSVRYNAPQTLTDAQKAQARANIDGASASAVSNLNDIIFIHYTKLSQIGVRKGLNVNALGKYTTNEPKYIAGYYTPQCPQVHAGDTLTINDGYELRYALWGSPVSSSSASSDKLVGPTAYIAGPTTITFTQDGYLTFSIRYANQMDLPDSLTANEIADAAISCNIYAGTNIDRLDSEKLSQNQGAESAGGVLAVNSDGDVYADKTIGDYFPQKIRIAEKASLGSGKYINTSVGSNWTEGLVDNSGSIYTEQAIDVSKYIGDNIIIEINSNASHTGVRMLGFCDSGNIVSKVYAEQNLVYQNDGDHLRATVRIEDRYFFFSCSGKSNLAIYVDNHGDLYRMVTVDTKYVSQNGNDENAGTKAAPYATVNKALDSGAIRVCVLGGVYEQTIDLEKAKHSTISIANVSPTEKVVFLAPNSLVTSIENAVSGYTKVYSATISKSFATENKWIFQDGIPDESTGITAEKRMPEQRGQEYRCHDTKIELVSAETLSDALAEIENSNQYKWYLDGTTLYFSRPVAVTANNPIRGSFNTGFFSNWNRGMTLYVSGIDVKYMHFNSRNTTNSRIVDCSVANVFGEGGFKFDGSVEIEFIRCEASRVYSGVNGDGFNAHSQTTGEAFAHQTTATLVDCWSHDNSDDGISLHERSEFTIIGGLFEQNMFGGGVTPASGSHCTCYNVYSRDNGDGGFLYMNPTVSTEGGVGGQIKCVGCVSESNTINESAIQGGYKLMSAGNKAILVSCKAISESRGYYVADDDGKMILIDCGAYDCTSVKAGKTQNIVAQNTTIVS